jgi:hypothetical protein
MLPESLLLILQMRLSPVTRYYLRQLLQQKTEQPQSSSFGWTEISIDQILDQVFRLETKAATAITELEVVLRVHQRLKSQKYTTQDRLDELEARIFEVLELEQASPSHKPSNKLMIVDRITQSPSTSTQLTVQFYLELLNRLSLFSRAHVGRWVVVNYWETARPSAGWLERFQINSAGVITFTGLTSAPITPEQQQHLEQWAERFVDRCTQAVPDFRHFVEQAGLVTKRLTSPEVTTVGMS